MKASKLETRLPVDWILEYVLYCNVQNKPFPNLLTILYGFKNLIIIH